jgi:hypothetical protein
MECNKTIKVWFQHFWGLFDKNDNVFTWILNHNYNVIVTPDNPDLVISGGNCDGFPSAKHVYFSSELYLPEPGHSKFILSSFHIPNEGYFRVPLCLLYAYDYFKFGIIDSYEAVLNKQVPENILSEKTNFCTYISQGAGRSDCIRSDFFHKLSQYKQVIAAGKHFNNHPQIPGQAGTVQGSINKMNFLKSCKFTMAFEGGSGFQGNYGWITEKIFEPMMAYSIPIYWGNIRINEDFNNKSFINWHDYGNDEAVIERIIEIDNNDDLYMDYMNEMYVTDKENSVFTKDYLINIFEKIINE